MANYFTQFSEEIQFSTDAQRLWLLAKLHQLEESEDGIPCNYEVHTKDQAIWVYTEESGDPGRVADLVADYQIQFELTDPWTIGWASFCGSPRLKEFHGGMIAVYRGRIQSFIPDILANHWIERQQAKDTLKPSPSSRSKQKA